MQLSRTNRCQSNRLPRAAGTGQAAAIACALLVVLTPCPVVSQTPSATRSEVPTLSESFHEFVQLYCVACHDAAQPAAGIALDRIGLTDLTQHSELWEQVARRLRTRQMPPADAARPDEATYASQLSHLESQLDALDQVAPNPGRTPSLRRLNRTEYANSIRDLLALEVDLRTVLPPDESSHGFDNVTVADLSPTLLTRYVSAAERLSRLALGNARGSAGGSTFRIPADVTQEGHVLGLPLGTRGGTNISYYFPQSGHYEVQVRLARDRNEEVEGLREPHQLVILLDRQLVAEFDVQPPSDPQDHATADQHLRYSIPVTAGPHDLGVAFREQDQSLLETSRQPYQAHFNMHRHPRLSPAVYQVSITGPDQATGPGETPSRRRILITQPASDSPQDEEAAARQILTTLMRRAYRRPVTDADLTRVLPFYREARAEHDHEAGLERALSAILVSPYFLFRIERDPPAAAAGTHYRLSDLELASRLSFFLWSSIPDDELLQLAIDGRLSEAEIWTAQVRRLLAEPRSDSLVTNFAAQWLRLRNLDSMTPDLRLFPDFDDNLRQSMRIETEQHFRHILSSDRSVLELLRTDMTFLNERLAKHYGVPHVFGSRYRPVVLDPSGERGGLLRQASVLTVTSYATRTSPVIRGKWVLEALLGTPPPPPPANVPALPDNNVSAQLSVRERLSVHRDNAACFRCHQWMDPIGLALENYDAVGRWRTRDQSRPIDATGGLPDGRIVDGPQALEDALLARPEIFTGTLAEQLLTFALGRGLEPSDAPAIRRVVRQTQAADYRFSALIVSLTTSTPFQQRRAE